MIDELFFLGVVIIRNLDHQAKPDDNKFLDLTKKSYTY